MRWASSGNEAKDGKMGRWPGGTSRWRSEAKVRGLEKGRESGWKVRETEQFRLELRTFIMFWEMYHLPLNEAHWEEQVWWKENGAIHFPLDKQIILDSLVVIKDFHGWDAAPSTKKTFLLTQSSYLGSPWADFVVKLQRKPGTVPQVSAWTSRNKGSICRIRCTVQLGPAEKWQVRSEEHM